MNKKKIFDDLDIGDKFLYERVLYIKIGIFLCVRISNGQTKNLLNDTQITPVKLWIRRQIIR